MHILYKPEKGTIGTRIVYWGGGREIKRIEKLINQNIRIHENAIRKIYFIDQFLKIKKSFDRTENIQYNLGLGFFSQF